MLGLDHIGHAFAARKDMVDMKLKEMDDFVRNVHDWIEKDDAQTGRKSLLLVMGDHGMTLDGNHGGGSFEETHAAAVFMSPHMNSTIGFDSWDSAIAAISKNVHFQEEIAATLTALLDDGLPLRNGYGRLLHDIASKCADPNDYLSMAVQNIKHLLEYPFKKRSSELDLLFEHIMRAESVTLGALIGWEAQLKKALNESNFEYKEGHLKLILVVLALTCIGSILSFKRHQSNIISLAEIVGMVLLLLGQSTTSYICEEQAIWQFVFVSLFLTWTYVNYSERPKSVKSPLLGLVLYRILAGWSSVGTLWAKEGSIADFLRNRPTLQNFSIVIAVCILNWKLMPRRKMSILATACTSLLVLGNRLEFLDRTLSAQLALALVLIQISIDRHLDCLAFIFMLLNRPSHAMAVALLFILGKEVRNMAANSSVPMPSLMCMALMHCAYYSLGLWNSVSAVDLTFGATFTSRFDMKIAPIVLLLHCFAGPILIYLTSGMAAHLMDLARMTIVLDATTFLLSYQHRLHPWVFDTFAPKVLFQVLWSVFFLLILPLFNQRSNKAKCC